MTSRNDGPLESREDRLALLQRCPLCRSAFDQQEPVTLEAHPTHRTVHLQCPQCQVSLLAMLVASQAGTGIVATVTDLSAADATLLMRKAPICEDELLACHALLQRHGSVEQHIWSTHHQQMS